jgi:hypothetical protein
MGSAAVTEPEARRRRAPDSDAVIPDRDRQGSSLSSAARPSDASLRSAHARALGVMSRPEARTRSSGEASGGATCSSSSGVARSSDGRRDASGCDVGILSPMRVDPQRWHPRVVTRGERPPFPSPFIEMTPRASRGAHHRAVSTHRDGTATCGRRPHFASAAWVMVSTPSKSSGPDDTPPAEALKARLRRVGGGGRGTRGWLWVRGFC